MRSARLVCFGLVTARAGWYPDPAGRPARYRWWDGSAWTRFLAADPAAPRPQPEDLESSAPAGTQDPADGASARDISGAGRHQATDPSPWQRAGAVVAAESQASRGSRPPGYERPVRSGSSGSFSLRPALLGIGAVVLVGLIVLAVAVFGRPTPVGLQPPPPAADGSLPAPSPTAEPSAGYDPASRKFAFDGLEITLPAKPYVVRSTEFNDLGGSPGMTASAPVHEDYNGSGSDWTAAFDVGSVPTEHAGKNIAETADKIIAWWQQNAFNDTVVTVKNAKRSTITKNLPRPARIVTADLHYKVDGVKSSYDRVSVLVAKGPSGEYVAFISSRPNDADARTKKALQDSIDTVHLT
ncbi:DUF2510 domain-containing protein [Microlunatus sp. Gsoil 973]|nr:DUF2510 domain-containing protein [Microlunatus sp. Gsoil 973]